MKYYRVAFAKRTILIVLKKKTYLTRYNRLHLLKQRLIMCKILI